MFSIIADKATDVSHNEQLCVAIRWVDSSMLIHETAVELIHVPKTDASTIAGIIKDGMLHLALPISQCCAWTGIRWCCNHERPHSFKQQQKTTIYVFVSPYRTGDGPQSAHSILPKAINSV